MPDQLTVRELTHDNIPHLINYWLTADKPFLEGMGVDTAKMPSRQQWLDVLNEQLSAPLQEKKSYCIIWLLDGEPVGHSNINKIVFGEEAYMHLHLWKSDKRKQGMGLNFVKMTIPYFFKNFGLKTLYCEPYAHNEAPNRTLQKAGFEFVKQFTTTPGWLNFEQEVKLWRMNR